MTYTEVVTQVKRMSQAEKLALLRVLADSLGQEAPRPKQKRPAKVDFQPGKFTPAKDSSLFRVLGALREEGKPAPTDDEVERMIASYLTERHA